MEIPALIEERVAENIDLVDAIKKASDQNNIDVESIACMWKNCDQYFALEKRRKALLILMDFIPTSFT